MSISQKFEAVTLYIFAPISTFIVLNIDEIRLIGTEKIQHNLVQKLNEATNAFDIAGRKDQEITWSLEKSEGMKSSKGVFIPPGQNTSFVMAKIINKESKINDIPINDDITDIFSKNSLRFLDPIFYFHEFGTATCSVSVPLNREQGLTILDLEEVSEALNLLYKRYFEDISYYLADIYVKTIDALKIPYYQFDFFPGITYEEKSKICLPWTHRIYHIHDRNLLELDNPGEPFQFLVTPSRQMDVEDMSIYDNRYIYFGWGHSLIFTSDDQDGYSQTSRQTSDYVRIVEIAQAKWQSLDILEDFIDLTLVVFGKQISGLSMRQLRKTIRDIKRFDIGISRIMDYYTGLKITFDTETRILLRQLNEKWLTYERINKIYQRIDDIEKLLDSFSQQRKDRQDDILNSVVLFLAIISTFEIYVTILDILKPIYDFPPIPKMSVSGLLAMISTIIVFMVIRVLDRG